MSRIMVLSGLLALLATASTVAEDPEQYGPPPSTDPRFEFLKSLEGTWRGAPLTEGMPEDVYEFRVTAGGHAVEEREMVGTPMEMVTLYFMEGPNLIANHYCMLGNRPRLNASRNIIDDTLTFSCAGKPGSAKSHDDEHVHSWSMKMQRDGRMQYSAELVKEGKVTMAPSIVLARWTEKTSR